MDLDGGGEQIGQLFGDVEAEAGALVSAVGRAVHLVEFFKDLLEFVGGDADAGVLHLIGEDRTKLGWRSTSLVGNENGDLAVVGEFDGVADEVDENLFEFAAVGAEWDCRVSTVESKSRCFAAARGLSWSQGSLTRSRRSNELRIRSVRPLSMCENRGDC